MRPMQKIWLCVILAFLAAILVGMFVEVAPAQQLQSNALTGVFYSFPALSATASSPWIAVHGVIPAKHGIQLNCTGSPASIAGNLEGSLDGVNATTIVAASTTCGALAWDSTGNKPVLFVRFTLTTLSGGSSPTVTPIYVGSK